MQSRHWIAGSACATAFPPLLTLLYCLSSPQQRRHHALGRWILSIEQSPEAHRDEHALGEKARSLVVSPAFL